MPNVCQRNLRQVQKLAEIRVQLINCNSQNQYEQLPKWEYNSKLWGVIENVYKYTINTWNKFVNHLISYTQTVSMPSPITVWGFQFGSGKRQAMT